MASHFKTKGYTVSCGDVLTFAHYFQIARVEANRAPSFRRLRTALPLRSADEVVHLLNTAWSDRGWLPNEYARKRRFFTRANAARIEGARSLIDDWASRAWLTTGECAVLKASLINSMDKVANTAGTYYAYLKAWYRKARLPFRFELLPPTSGNPDCRSFLCDALQLVSSGRFDILYLDPPYNERSYAHYYHLPESIALGLPRDARGKSGAPELTAPLSEFNRPRRAGKALQQLLCAARFKLLAFHYSDGGLIDRRTVRRILASYGSIEEFGLSSKGYTTGRTCRTVEHRLYLVRNA